MKAAVTSARKPGGDPRSIGGAPQRKTDPQRDVFTAVDSALSEQTIKAAPDGIAVWTPPAPGRYSVYTRETLKQPGTLGDQKYDEIREFATLALDWPLERHQEDPEAAALFKDAIAHRAVWHDFPGFSAELAGQLDGRPFTGEVTVREDGSVDLRTDDPAAKPWLLDQLDSLVMHRLRSTGGRLGRRSPAAPAVRRP